MKIALITGATSGIGEACALKFAEENYFVLVHGKRENNTEVVEKIQYQGGKAEYLQADFTKPEETKEMFAKIKEKWGKIDVLVNNAGMVNRKPDDELTVEDFQNLFLVNLTMPFFCAREAHHLGASSIVNIGSMRGLRSQATTPAYSAAKAGLHNLTASLAKKFGPDCRVNCVAPGFTRTPLHESNLERLSKEAELTPLKTYADPQDIAEAVFFLASDKARFITGEVMIVDGGRSLI